MILFSDAFAAWFSIFSFHYFHFFDTIISIISFFDISLIFRAIFRQPLSLRFITIFFDIFIFFELLLHFDAITFRIAFLIISYFAFHGFFADWRHFHLFIFISPFHYWGRFRRICQLSGFALSSAFDISDATPAADIFQLFRHALRLFISHWWHIFAASPPLFSFSPFSFRCEFSSLFAISALRFSHFIRFISCRCAISCRAAFLFMIRRHWYFRRIIAAITPFRQPPIIYFHWLILRHFAIEYFFIFFRAADILLSYFATAFFRLSSACRFHYYIAVASMPYWIYAIFDELPYCHYELSPASAISPPIIFDFRHFSEIFFFSFRHYSLSPYAIFFGFGFRYFHAAASISLPIFHAISSAPLIAAFATLPRHYIAIFRLIAMTLFSLATFFHYAIIVFSFARAATLISFQRHSAIDIWPDYASQAIFAIITPLAIID